MESELVHQSLSRCHKEPKSRQPRALQFARLVMVRQPSKELTIFTTPMLLRSIPTSSLLDQNAKRRARDRSQQGKSARSNMCHTIGGGFKVGIGRQSEESQQSNTLVLFQWKQPLLWKHEAFFYSETPRLVVLLVQSRISPIILRCGYEGHGVSHKDHEAMNGFSMF